MIKIAHRGNFNGRNIVRENTIDYLTAAIEAGYNVELDVKYENDVFWLGHDISQEKVTLTFLRQSAVWTHAKNIEALNTLWHHPEVNVFWHDQDDFTFTSKGIKWANFGVLTNDGIMVMPDRDLKVVEKINLKIIQPFGICCDDFRMFK